MRILMIGSTNPWRMEAAVERAFRRAGHEMLLFDDRRTKRLTGRALTQRWGRLHAAIGAAGRHRVAREFPEQAMVDGCEKAAATAAGRSRR